MLFRSIGLIVEDICVLQDSTGGEERAGTGCRSCRVWDGGGKKFFLYPNESLSWAYPDNLVEIRLIVKEIVKQGGGFQGGGKGG